MHIVVRRWRNAATLAGSMTGRSQDVEELLRGVPGFVAYCAVRNGTEVTTITACDNRAGTQESTRLAGEWVKQNVSASPPAAPEMIEGETILQFRREPDNSSQGATGARVSHRSTLSPRHASLLTRHLNADKRITGRGPEHKATG